MNKKRGFTLVELLAVIVVLGLILLIAVPQVMKVINDSKKGVLASSARLIASSAENIKLSNDTMGISTELQCSDVSKISSNDYEDCKIEFVNGEARVTIIGQGKYEGMVVCKATSENVEVKNGNNCPVPAVEKIESLAITGNTEGLIIDDTADNNIRYAGASPKNYISFNNELWRIIGTFNVTTASGNTEKLMKIVKNSSIGDYAWDVSDSGVNDRYGVNQWGASTYTDGSAYAGADLMVRLNDSYLNRTGDYGDTKTIKGINSISRSMIESIVWNTGAITYASSIERSSAYTQERVSEIGSNGEGTGKICTSGNYCNDSVTRTIKWTGKVGLIYPSDYGYASTSGTDIRNSAIGTTNWLNTGSYYWTLSPGAFSSYAIDAWNVTSSIVSYGDAYNGYGVRPAIYLKSDVSITSGEGTQASPYHLSMN